MKLLRILSLFVVAGGFPRHARAGVSLQPDAAIVSSLQAVGVVLVSAMLVVSVAAAFLLIGCRWATPMSSAVFGMASGSAGAFFSFVGRNLPTGPFMVLAAMGLLLADGASVRARLGFLAKTRSRRFTMSWKMRNLKPTRSAPANWQRDAGR